MNRRHFGVAVAASAIGIVGCLERVVDDQIDENRQTKGDTETREKERDTNMSELDEPLDLVIFNEQQTQRTLDIRIVFLGQDTLVLNDTITVDADSETTVSNIFSKEGDYEIEVNIDDEVTTSEITIDLYVHSINILLTEDDEVRVSELVE